MDDRAAEDTAALRQLLLAVAVLDDVDAAPCTGGVRVGLEPDAPVLAWSALAAALGGHAPSSEAARPRLRSWLTAHAAASAGAEEVGAALRVLALPVGHALHPGRAWVRARVLGGALEVGLGLLAPCGRVDPLWPDAADRLLGGGPGPDAAWARAQAHLHLMASLAVRRLEKELSTATGAHTAPGDVRRGPVLRAVGGCEPLTLLAAPAVRVWMADHDGAGLVAAAAPTRAVVWTDPSRTDAVFVTAAWSATGPHEAGLPRPFLVTADEVVLTREVAGPGGGTGWTSRVKGR